MIELLNMDCMEYMAEQPDNYFDLACVDPPYGIDVGNDSRAGKEFRTNFGGVSKMVKAGNYKKSDWDKTPPDIEYFNELKRVSKEQIIWGANHFCDLFHANSSGWIIWDKDNGGSNLADAELAYSSFNKAVRTFRFKWHGMLQGDMLKKESRIHPTQKPVKLYEWLLTNYAEKGQRILDTHLGSGSSAIAAHYFGCYFVGTEIDKDYYEAACQRFDMATRQQAMF